MRPSTSTPPGARRSTAPASGLAQDPSTADAPSSTAQTLPEPPVRYDTDLPSPEFHRSRRQAVMQALGDSALAVFFSAPERPRNGDQNYEYRQDSDLLYLTGMPEPGAVLLLAPGGVEVDGRTVRELLFVPPRDPAQEVWTGRRFGPERAMRELGVELAVDNTRFADIVVPILNARDRVVHHLPLPDGVLQDSELLEQLQTFVQNVDPADVERGGLRDGQTLRGVLDSLRSVKTPEEERLLRRAIDITAQAHREVMAAVEAGWAEYEIEALLEYVFKKEGAEHPGFPSIVGSGENSVILHYLTNRRRTRSGDVVVIDIGAELHGYSADVTRTIPVNGTFSPEQRTVYELVLRAQEAGIQAAQPGAEFSAPGRAAARVLAEGLAELGLIDGPEDQRGLRRYFMHGTSHYIGLDVHDAGPYDVLRPGNMITVEPGLYFAPAEDLDSKWWNIGVRIEDDILVTEDGPVLLSGDAPREPDAIEALMRGEGSGQAPRR